MIVNKNIALFVSMLLIVALTACGGKKKEAHAGEKHEEMGPDRVELTAEQAKLAGVALGSVEMRSLSGILKVSGMVTVAPDRSASVCTPLGGYVKSIAVMPGKLIRKGQVLSIVENQEFIDIQQNYVEARNKLEFAQSEYKRHNELYKNDVYSQKSVQQTTSEYNNLRAQVRALGQKLALVGIDPARLNENNISRTIAVRAPISGYVKAVNVAIGKYATSADPMFEIVDCSQLMLELTLFEKDASKVSDGQDIRFFINDEAEPHQALILQTGKAIGADRTYKVYARVTGKCKNLMPGMYVRADVKAGTAAVTAVPSEAVVGFDDKHYIFVFDKSKTENGKPVSEYRMVQVGIGVADKGFTEIVLPAGFDVKSARVVVKGAYTLLSAAKNAGEMSC
jgi:cobalt-zinc-cadmium efflux system membrane fusion protein